MKKIGTKEILILVFATFLIVVSGYAIWYFLNPSQDTSSTDQAQQQNKITGEIDETTYKKIESLSDYGQPNLDNIGKTDLFK